jgi:acetyl-CoA carboxylase carboxyltransferase component
VLRLFLMMMLLLPLQVPKVTVIIGGSFGAGNYGEPLMPFNSSAQLAADALCTTAQGSGLHAGSS